MRRHGKHFRRDTSNETAWLALAPDWWWLAFVVVVVAAGFLRQVDAAILQLR